MATETFTDDVIIDGSEDEVQLTIQGHTSQTEALQTWEDSAGTVQAQITDDGRFQNGDGGVTTEDALIEAHRDNGSSLPRRGFHSLGKIGDVLGAAISWSVHELVLLSTNALSTLHTALRVRLRNENTGTMTGVQLYGADIEVENAGGGSGNKVPEVVGLHVQVENESAGHLDTAAGLKVEMLNAGSADTLIGLDIPDVNQGTDNYAIRTGAGKIEHGSLGAGLVKADANGVLSNAVQGTDYDAPMDLDDLADVNAPTPGDGQSLVWDNATSKWIPSTITGGGESNTASNVGVAGVGVFKQKTGVDFEFKTLNAGSNKVSIADDTTNDEVDIDVQEANLTLDNLGGTLSISKGGTGATDAATARSNLGAQVQDALLDDIAALSGLAKGDLLVFDGSDLVELGVGSNGQHLEADSVQSTGLKWASPSGGGGSSPTGAVIGFAGSSAPSGWLLCDGSAVSRTTYADLFTAIGTSYGVGDGSTTFNLPDLRGRVPVGVGQGSGLTNRALAASFGAEDHQLTEAELASHQHSKGASHSDGTTSRWRAGGSTNETRYVGSTGSDTPHNNMQPSLAINYIIKS